MSSDPLKYFPGAPAPEGQSSNLGTRPLYNSQGIAIVTVCVALVTLGGLVRVYSLLMFVKKVHLEDCTSCKILRHSPITMAFTCSLI